MAQPDAAAHMQQLQRQLQSYDRHLAGLEQRLTDLQTAIATLEGLGEARHEAKIPIGGGIRIMATVDASAPITMDVGAGYAVEATRDQALAQLRERLQSTENAFRTASSEAEKIGTQMQQMQADLS